MHLEFVAAIFTGAAGASVVLVGAIRNNKPKALVRLLLGRRGESASQVIKVEPPHPGWTPQVKQPIPYEGEDWLQLDPQELGAGMYPFIISAVVPRPIAFISSLSKEGMQNLSPYSYFGVMSHDPPMVTIGPCHTRARPNGMKDSEQNILETKEFVVNIISEWYLEAANHTCGSYDRGIDELRLSNLTPLDSSRVRPPRIGEAAVQLECKLRHTYPVINKNGDQTATIVIGEVVLAHVHEGLVDHADETSRSGKGVVVDFAKYKPVSRLGGDTYARITEVYDLPRPDKSAQDTGPLAKLANPAQRQQ